MQSSAAVPDGFGEALRAAKDKGNAKVLVEEGKGGRSEVKNKP